MHAVIAFLTVLFIFQTSVVADEESTRIVRDCIQLQEALNRDDIFKVVVVGAIRCTRDNWQVPVVVQRNVEITGDPAEGDNMTAAERPSVDFTDVSHVVIVERTAVSVHDLVLYQDEMGVGGLTVKFIHTREGATAVFAGVMVIVASCSQNVPAYHDLIRQIPRPGFFSGEQRTVAISGNVLLVQDVAIWWPNLNSVWQLCNGIIVCVDGYEGEIPIDDYFATEFVVNSCAVVVDEGFDRLATLSVPTNSESEGSDDDGLPRRASTLIVVAAVIGVVILVTAAISYKCFRANRQLQHGMSFSSRKDRSSAIDEISAKEANSSRFLNNKNDMDLELFEKGTNVPLRDVIIGTLLGRGGFGKVFKGTWKGTAVAIKVITHGESALHSELRLPFEAYLSRHVNHPNVVQTFLIHTRPKDSANGITVDTLDLQQAESPGSVRKTSASAPSLDPFSNMALPAACMGPDAGDLFETWLVLEYCDRGTLIKAVRKGFFKQKDTDVPRMNHVLLSALDIANAMNYLHSLCITHGDLKAENVLLKSANNDRRGFFCKVSDFGLSRWVGENDYHQTFTYGTLSHMPPELLKNGALSTAVDVYSFGILLWELLATTRPYEGRTHGDILVMVVNEGRRPQLTDIYPEMYADLIKDCWKQNPDDRPKFSEIVGRLKKMLADLEIGSNLLRDVNDSAKTDPSSYATMEGDSLAGGSFSNAFAANGVFGSERVSVENRQEQDTLIELSEGSSRSPASTESRSSKANISDFEP